MEPTIGRVVILHTNDTNLFNGLVYDTSKPLAAIVTEVRDNGEIAATAFPPGKDPIPVYTVLSADNKEKGFPYWEWPEIKKEVDPPAEEKKPAAKKKAVPKEKTKKE